MTSEEWASQSKIARRLGVSQQAVSKFINRHGIKPDARGLYNIEAVERMRAVSNVVKHGGGECDAESFELKARQERARAELLEMKVESKRNALVSTVVLRRLAQEQGDALRSALKVYVDKIAPVVCAVVDGGGGAAEVADVMRQEMRATLGGLSRMFSARYSNVEM